GMRVSIILVIAICTLTAGSVATTRTRAATLPGQQIMINNCKVHFSDGPNAGKTEFVSFKLLSSGTLVAYANTYVGGQSTSGSWSNGGNTVDFAFTASLAAISGSTLTVTIAFPAFTDIDPIVGTSEGTIVGSNGKVLVVTHTTTTCPAFTP